MPAHYQHLLLYIDLLQENYGSGLVGNKDDSLFEESTQSFSSLNQEHTSTDCYVEVVLYLKLYDVKQSENRL